MKQFLLPDDFNGEKCFVLGKNDSHYLKNVLRYRESDIFNAVDINGVYWTAVFKGSDGKKVILELERAGKGKNNISAEADTSGKKKDNETMETGESDSFVSENNICEPEIILCQCLPKGKKMDLIVRQATEAGVSVIQPLMSEFSIVKYDSKSWKGKHERFMKIVREAFQQSGSKTLPEVREPVSLTSLEIDEKNEIGLFFHQKSIENISLHQYLFTVPLKIKLIIGPEGGLSDKEIACLKEKNFKPVFLGENVLRTETAALYAAAAVKTIILERDSWKTV